MTDSSVTRTRSPAVRGRRTRRTVAGSHETAMRKRDLGLDRASGTRTATASRTSITGNRKNRMTRKAMSTTRCCALPTRNDVSHGRETVALGACSVGRCSVLHRTWVRPSSSAGVGVDSILEVPWTSRTASHAASARTRGGFSSTTSSASTSRMLHGPSRDMVRSSRARRAAKRSARHRTPDAPPLSGRGSQARPPPGCAAA